MDYINIAMLYIHVQIPYKLTRYLLF